MNGRAVAATTPAAPASTQRTRPAAPSSSATALHALGVFPALRLGAVDDPLEREADRIAEAVLAGAPPPSATATGAMSVRRACAACTAAEEDETTVRRRVSSPASASSSTRAPASVAAALAQPGQPLPAGERAFFEPRLGRDLSDVRVHTGAAAARSAAAIDALAYTAGQNVAFAAGQWAPGTRAGRRLLAHELAHVAQAGAAPAPVVRRLPAGAFTVDGLHERRGEFAEVVFFDRERPIDDADAAAIDTAERRKIAGFAASLTAPARSRRGRAVELHGYASEEGPSDGNLALALRRVRAVRRALVADGVPSGEIGVHGHLRQARREVDYRWFRAVELVRQGGTAPRTAASRDLRDCRAAPVDEVGMVATARSQALAQFDGFGGVSGVLARLAAYDPTSADPAQVAVRDALIRFFAGSDAVLAGRVRTRLAAMRAAIDRTVPGDLARCADANNATCASGAKASADVDEIFFCPSFFGFDELTRRSILIHESAHAGRTADPADRGARDIAYRMERLLPRLSTEQALDNAESFSQFVRVLAGDPPEQFGPLIADDVADCAAAGGRAAAETALAWAQRWGFWAMFGAAQTYGSDGLLRRMQPHLDARFGRRVTRPMLAAITDRYRRMVDLMRQPFAVTCASDDCGGTPAAFTLEAGFLEVPEAIATVNAITGILGPGGAGAAPRLARTLALGGTLRLCPSFAGLDLHGRIKAILAAIARTMPGVPADQGMPYAELAGDFKEHAWRVPRDYEESPPTALPSPGGSP